MAVQAATIRIELWAAAKKAAAARAFWLRRSAHEDDRLGVRMIKQGCMPRDVREAFQRIYSDSNNWSGR